MRPDVIGKRSRLSEDPMPPPHRRCAQSYSTQQDSSYGLWRHSNPGTDLLKFDRAAHVAHHQQKTHRVEAHVPPCAHAPINRTFILISSWFGFCLSSVLKYDILFHLCMRPPWFRRQEGDLKPNGAAIFSRAARVGLPEPFSNSHSMRGEMSATF